MSSASGLVALPRVGTRKEGERGAELKLAVLRPFALWLVRPGRGTAKKIPIGSEQIPQCRILNIGRETARGRFFVGEPVAMRRPIRLVPLDRTMQLPLTLAGGLRTTFADVLSSPLPDRLAALMRRLSADRDERSGGRNDGASATETSSRIGRRGRRRSPPSDGGAVRRRTNGHHRVRKRGSGACNAADRRA